MSAIKGEQITVALAGNPNSGKTSIFNAMTGSRQKVGNWAGVTVEKKEGQIKRKGRSLKIVDLPGIYSLTPFSIEEVVTRNFLIKENPDVVINIVDATNLERALYLATQVRELDCKVIFALNMADDLQKNDIYIDDAKLSKLLGIPVVFTVGNKGEGIDELLDKATSLAIGEIEDTKDRNVKYSTEIEKSIDLILRYLKNIASNQNLYSLRWISVKLIENDKPVIDYVRELDSSNTLEDIAENERGRLRSIYGDEPEMIMSDERYGFIEGIIKEVLQTPSMKKIDISRQIDTILTNRILGLPIFAFFIWLMFQLTFSLGQYPMDWLDSFISILAGSMSSIVPDGILRSLIVDGIISGVGGVAIFLPNILILFFCIALFEDTGYMARAAFLMDRIMHTMGLHGKSFIPMLMGFGCNVPAIMAARTLENQKDRLLTILITPFMPCSARLPVFIVLAGAFFAEKAGNIIFLLYFLGILVAVLSGKLLRSTLLKGEEAPFVMELPPYRVPMLKSLIIHMWDRSKMFLKKMGGVILAGSIVVWTLSYFPQDIEYSRDYDNEISQISKKIDLLEGLSDMEKDIKDHELEIVSLKVDKNMEHARESYLGRLGEFISPVFEPLGIDWRGSVALVSGFVAKEIVVSTLGVLYGVDDSKGDGDSGLEAALKKSGMTPLSAFAMMVFVLLYLPCIAAIAAIKQESGSMKWTIFSIFYTTSVAWIFSFAVFQLGSVLKIAI